MPNNYYVVLGIERGADLSQIKHAYRQAIKRYHPDRGGSDTDSNKFRQAREAYEVLSDLERRRAHDAELRREGIPVHITRIPRDVERGRRVWRDLRNRPSTLDQFFEGWVPGFFTPRLWGEPVAKDLYMEVVLTPEEAIRGGVFPVAVPVMEGCPHCEGDPFCPACRGRGAVQARREFNLTIPPRTADGTAATVSLENIGLRGTRLFIDVRVSPPP